MLLVREINDIINQAEKFRNAYFWDPEKVHTLVEPQKNMKAGRKLAGWMVTMFTAEFIVTCTCSCTKARGVYTRNGNAQHLQPLKTAQKGWKI